MAKWINRAAPPGQRWCSTCRDFRALSDFAPDAERRKLAYCTVHMRERRRVGYAKDPDKHIDKQYKYRYGIEASAYRELFEQQNGVCAACSEPELPRRKTVQQVRLSIDHDHATGKIRGLLCSNCNTALGLLQESAERIEMLAVYLKKHTQTEERKSEII